MKKMRRKSLIFVLTLAMVLTTFGGFAAPAYAADDIAKLTITPVDSSGAAIAEPIPAGVPYVFYYKLEIEPSIDIVTVFQFTVEAPTGVELASAEDDEQQYGDGYWINTDELEYHSKYTPDGFYSRFTYTPDLANPTKKGIFIATKEDAPDSNLLNTKKTFMTIKATIANPVEGQTYGLNITNAMAANDPTGDAGEGNLVVDQTNLRVAKAPVDIDTATVTVGGTHTYNGNPIVPEASDVVVKVGGDTLVYDQDYTFVATNNTNAGTATLTVTGIGEYLGTKIATFEIEKAAAPTGVKAEYSVRYSDTSVQDVLVTDFIGLEGITDPVIDEIDGSINDANNLIASHDKDSFKLKDGLTEAVADKTASWTVFIGSTNHHYINANVTVTAIAKEAVTVDLSDIVLEDKVYDSQKISYTGVAKVAGKDGLAFSYTWYEGATELSSPPVHVGDYKLVVEVDNVAYYGTAEISVKITPKGLTIINLKATERDYDGTDKVAVTGDLDGVIDGDVVSLVLGEGTMDNANAGNNKAVSLTPALDGAHKNNYSLASTASTTVNIAKKRIAIYDAATASKEFDNAAAATVNYVDFTGLVDAETLTKDSDYSATGLFTDVNAGSSKDVSISVELKNTPLANNYAVTNSPYSISTGVITKATVSPVGSINISQRHSVVEEQEVSVAAKIPNNANVLSYTKGVEALTGLVEVDSWSVDGNGKVTYKLKNGGAGDVATLSVIVESQNYNDFNVNVLITLTDKDSPTVSAGDIVVTYTGVALTDSDIVGTATFDGQPVSGSFSWVTDPNSFINAGTHYPDVKFTPADSVNYSEVTKAITVKVSKASSTGTPNFTAITTAGKTLDDANLNVGTIIPAGTINWVDHGTTEVLANTSYDWEFVPTDAVNYNNLTGSIKVWTKSSSSSSSRSVKTYTLSFNTNGGNAISSVSKASGTTVDLSGYKPVREGYTFDGWYGDRELKNAVSSVTLDENRTVYAKWTEVEKDELFFIDVNVDDWFYEAVKYVNEKGLMSGTSKTTFSPKAATTRGMIVAILHRLEGSPSANLDGLFGDVNPNQYYAEAIAWASDKKIVSGYSDNNFGPEDAITREQMAVILMNYAKFKGYDVTASADLSKFSDSGSVSAWAVEAMAWANAETLIQGSGEKLMPLGNAERAQVAAILHRFILKNTK